MIDRRTFNLTALATAMDGRARTATAQQSRLPLVGFLNGQSSEGWQHFVAAFQRGLEDGGFVAGRTVNVVTRWAEGRNERLSTLAAELVAERVDVLVSTGGPDPALAAKSATTTIPVVFIAGPDPVRLGLVRSLANPGGNLTGFTLFTQQLGPKRLELLRELGIGHRAIAAIFNPDNVNTPTQVRELQHAAQQAGLQIMVLNARVREAFAPELKAAVAAGAGALYIGSDAYYYAHRTELVGLAAQFRLPAIYETREFVQIGGLFSYGVDFAEVYRKAGERTAQILKGARPADLPVEQPTKFELVLNLKTAKTLGLEIPPLLLARADEVIE